MLANMTLGRLIEWLSKQDPDHVVLDGFADAHSDRGSYDELAFDPIESTTFGEMLKHAKAANGKTFSGWKGGSYTMEAHTPVYIGHFGECGDAITPIHFKYWLIAK